MCGHDRLQGADQPAAERERGPEVRIRHLARAGGSREERERRDGEGRTGGDSMGGNTLVKELPWTAERNDDAIEHVCEGYALDIKARKQSVYDFWTGTNGICDGWIPSDLKRLAAQKAQQ